MVLLATSERRPRSLSFSKLTAGETHHWPVMCVSPIATLILQLSYITEKRPIACSSFSKLTAKEKQSGVWGKHISLASDYVFRLQRLNLLWHNSSSPSYFLTLTERRARSIKFQ